MADENKAGKKPEEMAQVPASQLKSILEKMAAQDAKIADLEAKGAGLEEMFSAKDPVAGEPKLREGKNFEPKFRTVRIRKYPIGDTEKEGYVVGWTAKGAYQLVDRSGVTPVTSDYLDIFFLGQAEPQKVKLLDLLNKGVQIHCKIIETVKKHYKKGTGEEINVTVFDPAHGLIQTGDVIDGFVVDTDVIHTIQIPGVEGTTIINAKFVN